MKIKFFSFLFCAAILGISSCSQSNKNAQDSISADSVAVDTLAAADSAAVADTLSSPSSKEEAVEKVNPEEVLSVSIGKKNLRYADESSAKTGTVTVKVTNNGSQEVKASDYDVTYSELVEETSRGEFIYVTKKRTAPGKDVAPGETATITLKAKAGCQDIKNPKIKNH